MSNPSDVNTERDGMSRAALIERLVRTRLASRDDATRGADPVPLTGADVAVTPLQRSLWLHGERRGHGNRQLLTWGARLTGEIDDEALVAGLRSVTNDPVVRVIFPVVNGELTCRAAAHGDPVLFIDRSCELARLTEADREAAGRRTIADTADDIDSARKVLALTCVRIDGNNVLLGLIAHHLIFDGRSMRLFLDRVEASYRDPQLKPPDDADRGPARRASRHSDAQESTAYWAAVLTDRPAGLMPARHIEPGSGGRSDVLIDAATTRRLRELADDHRATLFMVLYASVAIALHRAGAPSDVVIGVPVDTRRPGDLDGFGYFVNTLPFRLRWEDGRTTFDAILKKSRAAITDGLAYRHAALADIAASLRVSRDATASMFDVALNFLGDADDELHLDGVRCEPFDLDVAYPEFGLTITVRDDVPGLDIVLEYAQGFLDAAGAEALGKLLVDVLGEIWVDPEATIGAGTPTELFRASDNKPAATAVLRDEADASERHLQTQVAEVFVEVFGAGGPLTADDDFFSLGGYSLHATRVAAELGHRTGANLTLADVFDHSTVGELAALISARVRQ